MAAYAAVASLMNNIDQIMSHPLLSTSLDDHKQIRSLLERAALLLDFMEGFDYGVLTSNEIEDLERRIASTANCAEDVIQSHIVEQIRTGSTKSSLSCSRIIRNMDAVLTKAKKLKKKKKKKKKEGLREKHPSPPMDQGGETAAAMVGFDDDLIQLMDDLTNQQSGRRIISIVGMGGMGKTTLAQNIYHHPLIKQHFDIRAWATVSQQYTAQEILSQLLSGLASVGELEEQLHKSLYGRRYLIILDDIWSVEAWDIVRHVFPDNGNRSRVVLTTRMSNVARDCSSSCFSMKPLDEHASWKLFCKKAFQQENCPYPELEKVGKKIAKLCRGLPLSTVVIGGLLLNSPRSLEFWENVVINIKSNPNTKEKEESLDILSLSYNHLPPHLKPCFLYMGVFKEDSGIHVSKIIKLWVAEGFVRPNNTHVLEKIAEGYLKELIDRNMLLVSRHRHNGKIGSCGIHDLLRDLCLKVGQQQGFFHVRKVERAEGRLICPRWDNKLQLGPLLARTMPQKNGIEQPINHKLVRVWGEGNIESVADLYGNVNLRYLAYQPCMYLLPVWELPSSISLIWNLQTLIVKQVQSDAVIVAPTEIWEMRQLRHVECDKIYLPPPNYGFFMMDNLQTLKTTLNFRLSEEVCKIIPNISKLHLVYDDDMQGYDDDSLIESLCNLDYLHKLESLKLSVPNLDWEQNMTVPFPISLKKLSLCGCLLDWEDLWMIGSLPHLEVLELKLMFSAGRERWSPVDEQFLRLKVLKLYWCDLKNWDADNSHFPVLERLVLTHLSELEEIPPGIGEIPTLQLICLDRCSKPATVSAVKIKADQLQMGNDDLQIQLIMHKYEVEMESFKEMVEIEGITINDIQILNPPYPSNYI